MCSVYLVQQWNNQDKVCELRYSNKNEQKTKWNETKQNISLAHLTIHSIYECVCINKWMPDFFFSFINGINEKKKSEKDFFLLAPSEWTENIHQAKLTSANFRSLLDFTYEKLWNEANIRSLHISHMCILCRCCYSVLCCIAKIAQHCCSRQTHTCIHN